MQENPEFQEKKEPSERNFKAPGEHETGYTEKSWEKPERTMEKEAGEPIFQVKEEPAASEFKRPGEHETGYTEKSWEKPEKTMEKRLKRSKTDRMIFGVCGGIGKYFGIDPTIVRLGFALLALLDGIGIVLYIILAIIMPQEDSSR